MPYAEDPEDPLRMSDQTRSLGLVVRHMALAALAVRM